MNLTLFNSNYYLERLADRNCLVRKALIIALVIVWIVIFLIFFQILITKFISYIIIKYLKKNGLDLIKFHFYFNSFQFNFLTLCFVFKNVNLCIQNYCHIEISQIRFKLFKRQTKSSNLGKIRHLQFKNVRIVLFDKVILSSNTKLIYNIKMLSDNLIYDVRDLAIYLNRFENMNSPGILSIKRLVFTMQRFNLIKSQNNNYYLDSLKNLKLIHKRKPIYKKNDIESQDLNAKRKHNEIGYLIFNLIDVGLKVKRDNIIKANKLRIHFYNGNFDKYLLNNNKKMIEIENLSFMANIESYDEFSIYFKNENFDSLLNYSSLFEKIFYDFTKSFVFIVNFKDFHLNFFKDNETILKIISSNVDKLSSIEIARDLNKFLLFKFFLNDISIQSFLNSIYSTKFVYVNLKLESERRSIKINVSEKSNINLKNLIANYKLIDLISTKIIDRILSIQFTLIGSFDLTELEFPFDAKFLKIQFKQISFKIENIDKMTSIIIFENLNLFTNNGFFEFENYLFACSERLVLECKSKSDGTKLQFIVSPIQIGTESFFEDSMAEHSSETNLSTDSYESYLYTQILDEVSPFETNNTETNNRDILNLNNRLFLSVLQYRYESFKKNQDIYSNFYEFTLGDFFGSINFETFLKFLDLILTITKLIEKETEFHSFINKSELNYSTFRVFTSLINFNIFKDFDFLESNKMIVFNLICSPINYGTCNFHCENDNPGSLATISDICVKILTSNEAFLDNSNLIEVGIFYFKYLSFFNLNDELNNDKLVDYLRKNDQESKRLIFLWDENLNKCSCVTENKFYSAQREILYNYESDFKFKPCIYWLNKTDEIKYGFGQSILDPNEFIFYSYRKIFPEYDFISFKIQVGKKFTVLSNLESNDKYLKKKFEPLKISVYEQELNTFMNETIDLDKLNLKDIEELNFKSTNMSPPYFSNDFSIYIRYLPKVKKFSNIVYKPHEKSTSKECYNEVAYVEDSVNIPFSDLNVEFFNKTSSALKRINYNRIKNPSANNKKSFKKSLIKKSFNLKEIKDMKFNNRYSSMSSFSLNSLDESRSSKNINQNNNKSTHIETNESKKKKSVSYQANSTSRTRQSRKKSNLFVYKLNLNQILYGFSKQNDDKIGGKKLYVEEVYVQTVYISNEYEYENSYKDFLFEKSADSTGNQEVNETNLILSGLKFKICAAKTYFLLTKASIECVNNLLEFVYRSINRYLEQHVIQSENRFAFTQNRLMSMEKLTFDTHVYFDEIYIQIFQYRSGNLDHIELSEALRLKMTSSSILSNKYKRSHLIVWRQIEINQDKIAENFIDTLVCLSLNISNLINRLNRSIFRTKILSTNLIINQITLPEFQIDLVISNKHTEIKFEIENIQFANTPFKIHHLNNLIKFLFNSIYLIKNFGKKINTKPNYKISIFVKNFIIKFKLNHNSTFKNNYVVYLSGKNFKFAYTSDQNQKTKFNYYTNLTMDLVEIIDSIEKFNITFNFELIKKVLDANLFATVKLDDTSFNFNLIFPIIVQSEINFLEDKIEWHAPGIICYSTFQNQVYQLSDINDIKCSFIFNNEKLLIEIDKLRFIKSTIQFDLSSKLIELIDKIGSKFSNSRSYMLNLKIKNFCFNYFSDGFPSKSWFFFKLFDLNVSYSYLVDTNLVEYLNIDFKNSLLLDKNIHPELDYKKYLDDSLNNSDLRIKNSILLYLSSSSSIFKEFDFNKWLDYCCMENNEAYGYNVKFISALPCVNLEFNYETKVIENLSGKLVKIYWKFKNRDNNVASNQNVNQFQQLEINQNLFFLNSENFELIDKKIFQKKIFNLNASMHDRIENYYAHLKQEQMLNIKLKDLNGNLISNTQYLDFFDSKKLAFFVKTNLLKHILIICKILNIVNK